MAVKISLQGPTCLKVGEGCKQQEVKVALNQVQPWQQEPEGTRVCFVLGAVGLCLLWLVQNGGRVVRNVATPEPWLRSCVPTEPVFSMASCV